MPDLNDFEFTDIHRWKQQVLEDLGIKDIGQIDQIQLSEEIIQSPYVDFTSTAEDRLERFYRNVAAQPKDNGPDHRRWQNLEYIPASFPGSSSRQATEALNEGADGIIFEITSDTDYLDLFKDISPSDCYLGLHGPYQSLRNFQQYYTSNQSQLKGFASMHNLLEVLYDDIDKIIPQLEFDDRFRSLVIKESCRQNGTLDEVVRLLSQGVYVINALSDAGIALPLILRNIQFNLSMSNNYLWDICRLRCLRILFHQVSTRFGSEADPGSVPIHAFTSDPLAALKGLGDQDLSSWQLISNTTQAMAAILGGCDSLTVLPGTADGIGDTTALRVARNVSNILKEESFFHMTADPVAGSYYLEDLTHKMMKNVWSGFRELERAGGYRNLTSKL